MSSSRPDTAATKRDVDSEENIRIFITAREATTYDDLLLDGSISNADVRDSKNGNSGLHRIPGMVSINDILLYYLLTCDPPADVNGRSIYGYTSMCLAAYYYNTSAVKVLIDFGGDRTIKTNSNTDDSYPNSSPLDIAKRENHQKFIELLMEYFPSEE
jgi:hypothetical protein